MKVKNIFFVISVAWALGLGAATNAMAVVPDCSMVTDVTESCGWVITTPGCYKLQNSLTASNDAGDCIQINSSDVFLDLNSQTIKGTGASSTGNGVHVLGQTFPGAVAIANVTVNGGVISGFNAGVLVGQINTINTAPFVTKVRLDNINSQNNNNFGFYLYDAKLSQLSGLFASGNGQIAGLEIDGGSGNHVSNSTFVENGAGVSVLLSNGNLFSSITSSLNGDGIVISTGNSNQIDGSAVDANTAQGIWLADGSNGNSIAGGHANDNAENGIRLQQSSSNEISGVDLNSNQTAGIYIGCDGPTTGRCTIGNPSLPMSRNNRIDANNNITTTTNPGWGIAIDKGNLSNTVVGNSSSNNVTLDEYDGNKCGTNNWFANNFGTSNASCVH
jgi:parallel beta-helix repeat protein